jgi:hypothetical protein
LRDRRTACRGTDCRWIRPPTPLPCRALGDVQVPTTSGALSLRRAATAASSSGWSIITSWPQRSCRIASLDRS